MRTQTHLTATRTQEFMMGVLGDADTKDEVIEGFRLINRGADTAVTDKLEMVMTTHDVDYFTKVRKTPYTCCFVLGK